MMPSPSGSRSADPLYVEVTPLLVRPLAGIGRFVARLVAALAAQRPLRLFTIIQGEDARRMHLSTALLCGHDLPLTAADLPPGADDDLERWVLRLLRRPRARHDPALAARSGALFTMFRPPERHFRREVGVFYDFTPVLLPWAHAPEARDHFGALFAEMSGLYDAAVAISESTRADAAWLSALSQDAVVVGYPGPSLCVRAHAHPAAAPRNERLVLVVSTLEPRKNGRFLLNWLRNTDALPPGMQLRWVGPKGWLYDARAWAGTATRRGRSVRFLGPVSDRRLCELYRRAAFTIYPSLYEGFGFPVLDALLHGAPVATAFNSSLREFEGPGVRYFDACDPASLDAACRELIDSPPLQLDREDLRTRCRWDRLARTASSLCE